MRRVSSAGSSRFSQTTSGRGVISALIVPFALATRIGLLLVITWIIGLTKPLFTLWGDPERRRRFVEELADVVRHSQPTSGSTSSRAFPYSAEIAFVSLHFPGDFIAWKFICYELA